MDSILSYGTFSWSSPASFAHRSLIISKILYNFRRLLVFVVIVFVDIVIVVDIVVVDIVVVAAVTAVAAHGN